MKNQKKSYIKPILEFVALNSEERLAGCETTYGYHWETPSATPVYPEICTNQWGDFLNSGNS